MLQAKQEMQRLSALVDEAVEELKTYVSDLAASEHAYRQSKARAWVHVSKVDSEGAKKFAGEIEAEIDGLIADLKYQRDYADGMRQSALESLRSRRQQLSAWQSWAAMERAEAEFARTAP